jgi:hypothetical protein
MRPVLGFLVAHLALIAPGLLLLWCTGMIQPRLRSAALAIGPAYLLGVAMTFAVMQLQAIVGVKISLASALVLIVLLCAALWAIGRRRGLESPLPGPAAFRTTAERALSWLGIAITTVWFVLGSRSFDQLPTQVDDARIWSLRTLGVFFYGGLEQDMFTGQAYSTSHLDYPLLVPLLNSTIFRFMGGEDLRLVHLELWICMAAFAWTVGWALASGGRRVLGWLPFVVVLPMLSPVVDNIALGNVDTLVAGFSASGALLIALWLEDGRAGRAVIGGVLLGGAALTKNEGLIAALIVMVVALVVILARREKVPWRERFGPWLVAAGVVAFAIVPWQIWMAVHDISNRDVPGLGTTLSWSYLSDRTDRLDLAFHRLLTVVGNQGVYLWVAPAFLALTIAAIAVGRGRMRSIAAFYLASVLLFFASLLWVFWTGVLDIQFHLDTAADRTSITYMMFGLVGLAHLATSAVRWREHASAATAADPADRRPAALAAGDRAPTSAAPGPQAT